MHGSPFISEGIGKGGGAAETAMSLTQEMSNGWVGNLISTGVTMLGGVVKHGGGRNVGAPVVVGISWRLFLAGGEVETSLELLRRFLSGLGEAEVVVIVDELFEEVEVVEKYVGNEGKSSVAAATAAAGWVGGAAAHG